MSAGRRSERSGVGRSEQPRYAPEDSLKSPRFTGIATYARLPYVRTLEDVDLAIIGVPFDTGVSFRVGGRFGPNAIRSASVLIRGHNPVLEVHPFRVLSCVDYGDVAIIPGYIERSYEAISGRLGPSWRRGSCRSCSAAITRSPSHTSARRGRSAPSRS